MKIKSIVKLLTCLLLLSGLTVPATACCEGDPPGESSCYVCEDGAWVLADWAQCGQHSDCTGECHAGCWLCTCVENPSLCPTGKCCDDGDCVECPECGDCESCNTANCECECTSECCTDSDCDDCYDCVDCTCDWDCTTGQCCSGGSCVDTCPSGQCCSDGDCVECPVCGNCKSCNTANCECECTSECCTDTDCEYGGEGCESCVDCICEDDDTKCTGECHTCSGGNCIDDQSKCPAYCHTCSGGNCIDDQSKCPLECDRCSGGNCIPDNSLCPSDECCDDGICITRCYDNAAYCESYPPGDNYAKCENFDPTDKSCVEIVLGKVCSHRLVIRTYTAMCSICDPNCNTNRVGACAVGYAIRCQNVPSGPWVYCLCVDEDLSPSYYSGNYEICLN